MPLFVQFIGTGAFILTAYLDNCKDKNNYFKMFFMFILIFSVFEYIVGFVLEALFGELWWDYSDNKYNLNGRVTLLNSFLWGVITVLFAKFIYPLMQKFKEKVIYKIPNTIQIIMAYVLIICITVDFTLSCINYLLTWKLLKLSKPQLLNKIIVV